MGLIQRSPAWESREQKQGRVRTKEEQAEPRGPGSAWLEVGRRSPAHEFGTEMPINHDSPGPMSDICSQRKVEGWRCWNSLTSPESTLP